MAQGYSPLVISAVVWLADRGVDISLVQFQPYKRPTGEVLVTFSTLFPLPDLERSIIIPGDSGTEVSTGKLPFVEWTTEDLVKLGQIANLTTRSTLDLCSEQPAVPVSLTQIVDATGVARPAATAQLAGLTQTVKRRLERRNWPFTAQWDVDGTGQAFYVISEEAAKRWREAVVELDTEQSDAVVDSGPNGSGL